MGMDSNLLEERIVEVEKHLKIIIPQVYIDFLNENAAMNFDDGVLYDIFSLEERYISLEFDKYAPEYIPIGNDNGDYELVMKSGRKVTRFGFLEQGSIGTLKPEKLQNFRQWYQSGHCFLTEEKDDVDWSAKVQVILKKAPENKAKTMLLLKKALRLDIPISELMNIANKTPCVLTDKLSGAIAKKIITDNQLEALLEIKF